MLRAPALALLLLPLFLYCDKSNGQELPPSGEPATGSGSAAPAAPEGQTQGPNYLIEHPGVTVTASQAGVLQLRVTPSPGYKVNTAYPWLLTLETGDPLVLERLEWDATSAQALTEEQAVFQVPVTGSQPGRYAVDGHLRFSVCNDYRCDTPQARVAWAVTVQ